MSSERKTHRIGDVTISKVEEQQLDNVSVSFLYPKEGAAERIAADPGLRHDVDDGARSLRLSIHTWVIRTPDHLILVDTGSGNDKDRPRNPMFHRQSIPFIERLRDAGVDPEAVDFVLRHRSLASVNVFAMSWGGTITGAYTATNPDKVLKAVLAPQWLSEKPIPLDMGGELAAYRLVPVMNTLQRWLGTAPEHARTTIIPEGWFEQWATATLADDPWSEGKELGKLRATNGPIQDIRDYWRAGKPYYEPSDIQVPVLLLHGEWDIDVPIDLALAYFQELTSAPNRLWIEIGEATHMALLEKNRMRAFRAVSTFFRETYMPE